MITVGDKVIFRGENWGHLVSVIGTVIEDHGTQVVIEDQDAETEDNRLEFKKSELRLLKEDNHE
jgi:hypothetical protein